MTFIASIGQPVDVVAQTNLEQNPQTYGCVVSGLQASTAMIAHDGNQEGVAIELTPLGSRTLFGFPARELWDSSLELSDVVGPPGGELWERLQQATGWAGRFGICDDVLSHLAGDDVVAPELAYSWEVLVASGGRISIRELALDVGYSRQHLGRRFRDELGLSPKLAARVIRFKKARHMMQSVEVSLAQVAVACGYYDQAHLNKDFVELGGCTPNELFDEDLPFFQDESTTSGDTQPHDQQ